MPTPVKYTTPEAKRAANTANNRRWREKTGRTCPSTETKEAVRARQGRKRYGLTPEQMVERHAAQGGLCAICRVPVEMFTGVRATSGVIDHCHETGTVRGVLCSKCNVGLGSFRDRPELLEAAAQYLRARTPDK